MAVGLMIFLFLRMGHTEALELFFVFEIIDIVLMLYTMLVVVLLWGVLDWWFGYFEKRRFDFTVSKDLIRAVVILSLVTFPMVLAASAFSEFYIKVKFECIIYEEALWREIGQGQIFAWLIISGRIIRVNSVQAKKLEQDKALVQKELLQSQYQNLKNQVKPHFLFNSFSVLQSLIQTNPEQAEQFLSRLSKMYRYVLENREDAMSSLEMELEVVKHYLYLLNVRHEEAIKVNFDIDSEKMTHFIPTMSLQMLIENAEKHNRFSKREPLLIDIFTEGDYLVVKNRGNRQGEEVVSTKVGLENIRSQYGLQSDQPVVIIEDAVSFTVKMPILSRFRLA
jgi:hypothetical protein